MMDQPYTPNAFTHLGLYECHKAQTKITCAHKLDFLGTAISATRLSTLPECPANVTLVIVDGAVRALESIHASYNATHVLMCSACNSIIETHEASEEASFPHLKEYPICEANQTNKSRRKPKPNP